MYIATNLLSTTSSLTQEDLRLSFLGMFTSLKNRMRTSSQSKKQVAATILQKLEKYWELHLSESSSISAILNPCYKLTILLKKKKKSKPFNFYIIYIKYINQNLWF